MAHGRHQAGREAGGPVGASEGPRRAGREAGCDGGARGGRGDRHHGAPRREARRRPLRLHVGGGANLQGRQLLSPPVQLWTDRQRAARARPRSRRRALAAARRSTEAPRLQRRAGDGGKRPGSPRRRPLMIEAMYALNFYSPIVADQLRSLRKTATIRLGDKSAKYKKGMVVQVLAGSRFSPRERIFEAVIDKVEVKALGELSPREIEHDNPEIRRPEEMAHFLSQLYNRDVTEEDVVTVIRFSKIK